MANNYNSKDGNNTRQEGKGRDDANTKQQGQPRSDDGTTKQGQPGSKNDTGMNKPADKSGKDI
ncbi:hypothetical protein [Arenimonas sp.]|uniref:hypothetical protein n=1 Tax=Arenimonas sp. TaxID=1872635 RepID=UPI0039E520E9